jgi:hypothetical protein
MIRGAHRYALKCVREDHSVSQNYVADVIVTSIHRIDFHRKNLICGCHTTRGVKQPYTHTEALRHGGTCLSHQRAGQLMGGNWRCDVSSQCVILTYLLLYGVKKKQPCDSGHLYIRIAVGLTSRSGQKPVRGQLITTEICFVPKGAGMRLGYT